MLEAPAGMNTRPTSDRLRETLFNILATRIAGARFADLYAGSGAVGLEAVSRGAAWVEWVERAPAALKALNSNLGKLGVRQGVAVRNSSVAAWIKRQSGVSFDLIFLDPPYDMEAEYENVLGLLGGAASSLLAPGALVIAEHRRKDKLAASYGRLTQSRLHEQGDAALSFFVAEESK